MDGIESALANHTFRHLFIECLGWDRAQGGFAIDQGMQRIMIEAVAQKRGFVVFTCATTRAVLADRGALRAIQRQLRGTYHEHILIHYSDVPRKQVWQWALMVTGQRTLQHREHPFFSDQPPPRLLERLRGLAVSMEAEEQTTLPDVLHRVRQALLPHSELNLFAKHPWYAAQSDNLAIAVKRGEAGSLAKFIEFHIPLARHSSRMLVRWFEMDPEDAQQTAMIGLIEAARRFDPERGYQFSTYAGFWLRQACQRYGIGWGLSIRVPTHIFWSCYRMTFVETELVATYGRHEARSRFDDELARVGVSRESWALFCASRHFDRFSDLEKQDRRQFNREDPAGRIVEQLCTAELQRDIRSIVDSLGRRQAMILKLRHGIGFPEHTLQEVAEMLGITRERVRQIQVKAEERLQRLLRTSSHRAAVMDEWRPAGEPSTGEVQS